MASFYAYIWTYMYVLGMPSPILINMLLFGVQYVWRYWHFSTIYLDLIWSCCHPTGEGQGRRASRAGKPDEENGFLQESPCQTVRCKWRLNNHSVFRLTRKLNQFWKAHWRSKLHNWVTYTKNNGSYEDHCREHDCNNVINVSTVYDTKLRKTWKVAQACKAKFNPSLRIYKKNISQPFKEKMLYTR